MPGAKERSGGKRDGAGRKPASFRLKFGDTVLFRNGDFTQSELGEVVEITRSKIVIQLKDRKIEVIR